MIARFVSSIAILLLVFTASRALIYSLPGDPLDTLLAETGTSIPRAELRAELGLDRPFFTGLNEELRHAIFQGDFGKSIFSREPVGKLVLDRLRRTSLLALCALALGLAFSLIIGLTATGSRDGRLARWANHFCTAHGALAAALPTPWIGPILLYVFAVAIPVFPLGGSLVLPAITLAFSFSGLWARLLRERVRESLRLGAAPGARARGISEWKVVVKYGLAPVSGSLLAFLGTQIGSIFAGAFVTEVVFAWPGMGTLLIDAVLKRDYPVIQAAIFFGASFSLLGIGLGDALQAWMDPRIREK